MYIYIYIYIYSIELDFYKHIQGEYVLQYSNRSSLPSTVGTQPFLAMYNDVETRITLIIFLGHKDCGSPLKRHTYTNCHLLIAITSDHWDLCPITWWAHNCET